MNINIDNLPEMPFEADWEYRYGPVVAIWRNSLASGVVYHFYHFDQEWEESESGDDWVVYARPKPEPAPEPEPCIDMPIEWKIYPTVYVSVVSGNSSRRVADIGLVHMQDEREYRLARFLYSDGTSLRFSVDDNIRGDTKATHARFYLVAE